MKFCVGVKSNYATQVTTQFTHSCEKAVGAKWQADVKRGDSYESPLFSEWLDLNQRPLPPQGSALPTAPHPDIRCALSVTACILYHSFTLLSIPTTQKNQYFWKRKSKAAFCEKQRVNSVAECRFWLRFKACKIFRRWKAWWKGKAALLSR